VSAGTRRSSPRGPESVPGNWLAGLAGGLVGSAASAALLVAFDPATLSAAVPAMYGLGPSNPAVGAVVLAAHGGVLGVGFAALVGATDRSGAPAGRQVGLGLAYGLLLWAALGAVVVPVWLSAVGFEGASDVPALGRASPIGHAAYGAFLGATYHALEEL
jgi:hypothetical protein